MADITGVLLAAGFGSRFGNDKLLYEIEQLPMIVHSMRALVACDRTIAVVRCGDHALHAVLQAHGVDCVFNAEPERGMGSSIACAVKASSQANGWCLLPADMPFVSASTTQRLVDVLRADALLAAPYYRGRRGHPVAFSRAFFDALSGLDGDTGARDIVQSHADRLIRIDIDDAGVLADIDTPEDVARNQ